jgi:[ribosomal protein S5]-alanine N-acetyltransferase
VEPRDKFITERLVLRRPALTDTLGVYEYASDPEVTRFMDWPTHQNARDALNFLRRCTARWEDGTEYTWAMTLKPEDHVVGAVSCRIQGHAASMGYVLNRRYWDQGYATEAAATVMSWIFTLLPICRVWATCDAENLASACVLEKLEMTREGVMRKAVVLPNIGGEPRDALLYARIRS